MNRRELIKSGTAAAAMMCLPVASGAAPSPRSPTPAWVVGTPGEYDWQFIRAMDEAEALSEWHISWHGAPSCNSGAADCDCEICIADVEVTRVEGWDTIAGDPKPGDWMRAGLGHTCCRCGEETHREVGGYGVGNEAVCEDCMQPDDLAVADPKRAARLRAKEYDDDE